MNALLVHSKHLPEAKHLAAKFTGVRSLFCNRKKSDARTAKLRVEYVRILPSNLRPTRVHMHDMHFESMALCVRLLTLVTLVRAHFC